MIYFVYIIRSKSTQKFYTGMTNSISRRLHEHNQMLSNTKTTKYLTDNELVFCQEISNRQGARVLEKYLKSGAGREIREQIVNEVIMGS